MIVDANVFIRFERQKLSVDLSRWAPAEDEVFISAITVSELLMGVYRADTEVRRTNRSEFVEAILRDVTVLDLSTAVARRHAQLHFDLTQQGQLIGPHDMIIAATALHHGLSLLTDNVSEFSRVAGSRAKAVAPASDFHAPGFA
jgi:tRNA(fMet)-specific endonuclease VapC